MATQLSFDNTETAFKYKSDKALKHAQLLFGTMSFPTITAMGITVTNWALKCKLPVKGLIKKTIYKQFCGGENLNEIAHTTTLLEQYGVDICLDYGVEGANSENQFDNAVKEFIKTIQFASTKSNIPFIPLKVTGFAFSDVMETISSGKNVTEDDIAKWQRSKDRIDIICKTASDNGLKVLIDAEESWMQQAVDDLADDMMAKYNMQEVHVYNTFQMYRHDRLEYIKKSHRIAAEKGYKLGVKIVRGAYMEKERFRAQEMGYPSPIQPDKEATDRDYNLAIDYAFEHLDNIALFIGTHNEFSSMKGAEMMATHHLSNNDSRIAFSQLYGMSDNITFNLANQGFNASKYLPYGPVDDVIPYLMRRAQENTSVAGQTNRELTLINKEIQRRKQIKANNN